MPVNVLHKLRRKDVRPLMDESVCYFANAEDMRVHGNTVWLARELIRLRQSVCLMVSMLAKRDQEIQSLRAEILQLKMEKAEG